MPRPLAQQLMQLGGPYWPPRWAGLVDRHSRLWQSGDCRAQHGVC
jgi:hypothetical protein